VHASGYASMLRFDTDMFTQTVGGTVQYVLHDEKTHSYKTDGASQARQQAALYDRAPAQFGTDARTLCNKCHAKD
jgi:hypothetical protein